MIKPTIDQRLSTGLLSMDARLGGGLPRGSIVEIYGNKSSGRSAFATNCIAWAQKAGYSTAVIDASDGYDAPRADKYGVNLDELWYAQERSLEATLEAVRVGCINCDLTVLDCLASRPGATETMGSSHYLNRDTVSAKLRELAFQVRESNSSIIIVNQGRQAFGYKGDEVPRSYYGDLVRTYADIQIKLTEGPAARDKHKKVGVYVYAKVLKAYGVQPYTRVQLRMNEDGFDYVGDVVDYALQMGLLERRGPYVMMEQDDTTYNLGKTYNEIIDYLDKNESVWYYIEDNVRKTTL